VVALRVVALRVVALRVVALRAVALRAVALRVAVFRALAFRAAGWRAGRAADLRAVVGAGFRTGFFDVARGAFGCRAVFFERVAAVFAAFRPARARAAALRFALAMTLLVGPAAVWEKAERPLVGPRLTAVDKCRKL
jgi:hypothetical protein